MRVKKYTIEQVTKLWGVTINALAARLITIMGWQSFTTEEAATALVNDPILAALRKPTKPTPLKDTVYAIILYANREWVDLGGENRPSLEELGELCLGGKSWATRIRVWEAKWRACDGYGGGYSQAEPRLVPVGASPLKILDVGEMVRVEFDILNVGTKRVGFLVQQYADLMLEMRYGDAPYEICEIQGPNEAGNILVRYEVTNLEGKKEDLCMVLPLSPEECLSIDTLQCLHSPRWCGTISHVEEFAALEAEQLADLSERVPPEEEARLDRWNAHRETWQPVEEVDLLPSGSFPEQHQEKAREVVAPPMTPEDLKKLWQQVAVEIVVDPAEEECQDPGSVCEPDCYDCDEPKSNSSEILETPQRREILGQALALLVQEEAQALERVAEISRKLKELEREKDELHGELAKWMDEVARWSRSAQSLRDALT
jgi:hypothetical protein